MNSKNLAFSIEDTVEVFKSFDGYYNLANTDLARLILKLDLLEEKNSHNPSNICTFIKWSFTVSFLQMMNAWQWFFAGILLGRDAYLPAQIMQMYYYSIFFSYKAFLSFNLKGNYTVKVNHHTNRDFLHEKKVRRNVWLNYNAEYIEVENPTDRGGEHENTAAWFYRVFSSSEFKNNYPDVRTFIKEEKWHVYFRNLYTYSLADIAEELYCAPTERSPVTNKILIALWRRNASLVDYFPEEFWSLEHLKVITELHLQLLNDYVQFPSLYTEQQRQLMRAFYRHHCKVDLGEFIEHVFGKILIK